MYAWMTEFEVYTFCFFADKHDSHKVCPGKCVLAMML